MSFLSPLAASVALLSALAMCNAAHFRGAALQHQNQLFAGVGPSSKDLKEYATHIQKSYGKLQEKVSLSVFVFSRVDGVERRGQIREMWLRVKQTQEANTTYNFAVCGGSRSGEGFGPTQGDNGLTLDQADASLKAALEKETKDFNDVVYLDCDEGYGEGALTRKVLASMKYFWANHANDYFMKIDDDSFLAWSKYLPRLQQVGHHYVYMGIPIGEGVPCRNESFRWYEPWTTFDKPLFPKGMSGGSGYTIGRKLVDIVLNTGLGESHVLYNEDRSVGVWMDEIVQSGTKVDYEGIDGVDGFWAWDWEHPGSEWETWGEYPYTVHHGLEGQTIGCLAEVDLDNKEDKTMKECFTSEEGKQYEPLRCAELNKDAKDQQKKMNFGS
jgi:hypothetical protein